MSRRLLTSALVLSSLLASGSAAAHSFGRMYNLPVPLWMYTYGAAAALVLSFVIVGFFSGAPAPQAPGKGRDLGRKRWVHVLRYLRLLPALKLLSVAALLLCVASGFIGNRNPYLNFNMTFFWVVFVLGFAYLTALIGDAYAAISPWRVLADAVGRYSQRYRTGLLRYPQRLAYWPALALYMGFIWIELFAHTRPFSLSAWLAGYTVLNLLGAGLVGIRDWFRYCEFFSLFLRLTAKMAPFDYVPGQHLRWRWPFAGLLQHRAESLSVLVFILFMLSSTAFDGLRATVPWIRLFWQDPYNLITPLLGTPPVQAYMTVRPWYLAYETLCLLLSPFVYLAVYLFFIELSRRCARSSLGLMELALRFAHSLLPIALVYNITHYYTLILTQGVKVVSLLSDPFGWGWNLFGTANLWRAPILPDMGVVWHSQVGLILFGHIVSVWLAHLEALRTFPNARAATLSQLPMLVLMVLFTTAGLWILAQPIQSGM